MPTTPIAREAEQLCREMADRWLRDHCYRTFAFGALLGRRLPCRWDAFFIASMLHDIGLTAPTEEGMDQRISGYPLRSAPCFAVRGAGVARGLATKHDWRAARRDALADAISVHVNVRVTRHQGIEAHLLNAGSALDVVGFRLHRLAPETVRSVEDEWPRGHSFRDEMWRVWLREAEAHPECRGRLLNIWGSFRRRIYRSRPKGWDDFTGPS